ncbi:MAG TPA: hypothetical protein P5324_11535 [Anaerohalosphaeraceae bacterium]|nr:hypothetical protein [Anaerohalosphaeraceae bacterium]
MYQQVRQTDPSRVVKNYGGTTASLIEKIRLQSASLDSDQPRNNRIGDFFIK